MCPTPTKSASADLFKTRFENILNLDYELLLLAQAVDWEYLSEENAKFYQVKEKKSFMIDIK